MSPRARTLAAAGVLGAAFGFLISWGQFSSPDRIREMLLLEDPYLWEMMFTAIVIGFVGLRLLRGRRFRALLTGEPVTREIERPRANHVAGGAIFGLGWAVTLSCPAPVAAQLAQGVWWSLFTIAGIFIGIELFLRRQERPAREARRKRPRRTGAARPAAAGR